MRPTIDSYPENHKFARIIVIGIGGCGLNSVKHLIQSGVQGVKFMCLDTDAVALADVSSSLQIQVVLTGFPATNGSKNGSSKLIVRRHLTGLPTTSSAKNTGELTDNALQEVFTAIFGADLLFLTAGLGGRTASKLAPVIAKMAQDLGIPTAGVLFFPFDFEGPQTPIFANESLEKLNASLTMMSVISNEKIMKLPGDTTQCAAFELTNGAMKNALVALLDIGSLYQKLIDTESRFAPKVLLNRASSFGLDGAALAMGMALECPLLENQNLSKAKGILVKLTAAAESLHFSQFTIAKNILLARMSPNAKLIIQTVCDNSLDDVVHVAVLAVGM
jgi:cell division protein FtsZ